jgi:polyhydroxyalkanoate synthesis regulator phasin
MAKTAKDARAQAGRLTQAADHLDRVAEIDARLAQIKTALQAANWPLPKDEVADRLVGWLRARRERFEEQRMSATSALTAHELVSTLSVGNPLGFATLAPEEAVFDLLLFLIGGELEEKVRAAIQRLNLKSGLGSRERVALTANLGAERCRLVDEREQLVEELRSAGVDVGHLDETQSKRAIEEDIRQAQETQRRQQAEASAAIEARRQEAARRAEV